MYRRAAELHQRSRLWAHRSLAKKECILQPTEALVSFTFDDFPRSAYTSGGAILRSYGARGTFYASLGLMTTTTDLGQQFTADDVERLLADGHELGCHTFSHLSCSLYPVGAIKADLQKNQAELSKIVPGYQFRHFAYPYGEVTVRTKRIAGHFFSSSRSIYPGINGTRTDLNLLRAAKLYNCIPWAQIQKVISDTVVSRGWLIFYTHDVQQDPSPYGCTPKYLDDAIKCALESGAKVLSVSQVLARIPDTRCK